MDYWQKRALKQERKRKVIKMPINFNDFELTDEIVKEFDKLTRDSVKASKEQNELRDGLASIAEIGKILYDECLKQKFSENEAIKFSAYYTGNLCK